MRKLIQWPRAKYWTRAWNPVIGCRAVSPACENCWAREWAGRFGQSFTPHGTKSGAPPQSGVVFCGNLTDLFGEWRICGEMTFDIIGTLKSDPVKRRKATYLWLTKRATRMMAALEYAGQQVALLDCGLPDRLPRLFANHYFGFTAEDQTHYAERLYPVYRYRAAWARCWVSCEPLLGPINLRLKSELIRKNFSWVVVGCESGKNRRPCKVEWVEGIVEQCMAAGVPVFVKQLNLGGRCVTDITKFPEHLRIRQVPWEVKKEGGK